MIKQEWVEWARQNERVIRDFGHIVFPNDGAVFVLDKSAKRLVTIAATREYLKGGTNKINREVWKAIGYQVVCAPDVSNDVAEAVRRVKSLGGMALIHDKIVIQPTLDEFKPTPVEEIMHEASGGRQPINPITVRGVPNPIFPGIALTIGRIWLSTNALGEGQHRFDPRAAGSMEKAMQFVVYFNDDEPVVMAFAHAEEDGFVRGVKSLRTGLATSFAVAGQTVRGSGQRRDIVFMRVRDLIMVTVYEGESTGPEMCPVLLDYRKFDDGLDHLFVRGELATPESN